MATYGDSGYGATLAFSSTFIVGIRNIDWGGIARDVIEISSNDSTSAKEFIGHDLYDPGELSLEFVLNPNQNPFAILTAPTTTVTLTFPIKSGNVTGAAWAGNGFLTSYEPAVPYDGEMVGSATIKMTGVVTVTTAT